jgi:hypothetical protein
MRTALPRGPGRPHRAAPRPGRRSSRSTRWRCTRRRRAAPAGRAGPGAPRPGAGGDDLLQSQSARGERAGLVGADDVDVAQRLHRVELLHERALRHQRRGADGVRHADEEEQPVRHEPGQHRGRLHDTQERQPLQGRLQQDRRADQSHQHHDRPHDEVDAGLQRSAGGRPGPGHQVTSGRIVDTVRDALARAGCPRSGSPWRSRRACWCTTSMRSPPGSPRCEPSGWGSPSTTPAARCPLLAAALLAGGQAPGADATCVTAG